MCQQKRLRSPDMCLIMFYAQNTDSIIFTTRLYNNMLIEKSIYYWTPPSWFNAENRLETGSQGLIQTGFGFSNGMRNMMNSKPVSVSVCKTECALNFRKGNGPRQPLPSRHLTASRSWSHRSACSWRGAPSSRKQRWLEKSLPVSGLWNRHVDAVFTATVLQRPAAKPHQWTTAGSRRTLIIACQQLYHWCGHVADYVIVRLLRHSHNILRSTTTRSKQ